MKSWLRAKQALTALDVVMRRWGRQLGLDEVELVLVMLLGEVRGRCGADLAELSGRSRQNVNRSLFALRERGLVEAKVDHRGRAQWCCWWSRSFGGARAPGGRARWFVPRRSDGTRSASSRN